MKKTRWIAVVAAANLIAVTFTAGVPAAHIRIISSDESEMETEAELQPAEGAASDTSGEPQEGAVLDTSGEPAESEALEMPGETADAGSAAGEAKILNPADEGITSQEAVSAARTLYSQMQHYADINDNTSFTALFESGADAHTVQDQLQAVKSSLGETSNLTRHVDLCFFDPTQDNTKSPYYFAVALCDYDVDVSGAVSWYSTLMRLAKFEDGWKASISPAGELLAVSYPDGFTSASDRGRNAVDLYPSLGMRFASGATFEGALYALPNLLWQDENGDVLCAVWLANGTSTSKWCDTIDLVVTDEEAGDVMKVNVPVQTALEGGQSCMVTCTIPAEYVDSGTKEWSGITIHSNLKYQ